MNTNDVKEIAARLRKGSNSKGFLFFSDFHQANESSSNPTSDGYVLSPASRNPFERLVCIANEWGSSLVNALINGGDTIGVVWGSNNNTQLNKYWALANKCEVDVLTACGNHDCWGDYFHHWLSESDLDSLIGSHIDSVASRDNVAPTHYDTNSCWYYKDYGSIRVIVINAVYLKYSNSTYDGVSTVEQDIYWDASKKTWLTDVLASAKTAGKHVLMVQHIMPNKSILYETTNMSLKNFKKVYEHNPWFSVWGRTPSDSIFNESWMPEEVLEVVHDEFIAKGGIFIGWLEGHTHYDLWWGVKPSLEDTYGKQMIFTTGCCGSNGNDALLDPATEDLFNYIAVDPDLKTMSIVRIGVGWDKLGRERSILVWDYENKVVLRYK